MKIQEHTDLEVYKKAFDAAMLIFRGIEEVSRKKKPIRSLIKSDGLLGQSVRISLKLGGSGAIKRHLSRNFPTPKAKLPKPRSGSHSRLKCGYLERDQSVPLYKSYDEILRMLVAMINKPQSWVITR